MGPQPLSVEAIIQAGFSKVEQELRTMDDKVSEWIYKVEGIDNVAFAILYMRVNEQDVFKLSDEGVAKFQAEVKHIVAEFAAFREVKKLEAEKKAKDKKSANKAIILK